MSEGRNVEQKPERDVQVLPTMKVATLNPRDAQVEPPERVHDHRRRRQHHELEEADARNILDDAPHHEIPDGRRWLGDCLRQLCIPRDLGAPVAEVEPVVD